MNVVGLDIGGANLKASNQDGVSFVVNFPLWKESAQLAQQIKNLLTGYSKVDLIAVTMTGELADCFTTKQAGIDFILAAIEEVCSGVPIYVWQTGAEFVTPEVARTIPLLVSASNWHALATWMGRSVPYGASVLVDIGSTTSDFVPLSAGVPIPRGLTDVQRLQTGELVYSGVSRTPVCALVSEVILRDSVCRIAAELFATMLDVYLILGKLPEDPNDDQTANGKPATLTAAYNRLARMLCCDQTEISITELQAIAHDISMVQQKQLSVALENVLINLPSVCEQVIISGSGSFLGQQVVASHPLLQEASQLMLADTFSEEVSQAACAFAVAHLANERLRFAV